MCVYELIGEQKKLIFFKKKRKGFFHSLYHHHWGICMCFLPTTTTKLRDGKRNETKTYWVINLSIDRQIESRMKCKWERWFQKKKISNVGHWPQTKHFRFMRINEKEFFFIWYEPINQPMMMITNIHTHILSIFPSQIVHHWLTFQKKYLKFEFFSSSSSSFYSVCSKKSNVLITNMTDKCPVI